MDIRCRKTECKFNNKYTCQARGITIEKSLFCSQYENGGKPAPDTTRSMFETAPEYAPQRDSRTICIKCKTNCIFVHDGECEANGITVNSVKEKPVCMTYLKK